MHDTQLEQLVAERYRRLVHGDHTRALTILEHTIGCFSPQQTDLQPIRWDGALWAGKSDWHDRTRERVEALQRSLDASGDDDCRMIRRRDVFNRADAGPVDLFLAVMAWGFGTTGYGWWRTVQMVNPGGRNCEKRVAEAVERYRSAFEQDGSAGVARAWSKGVGKIPGAGPAFASKLAYFACYDRKRESGPLVVDINTAWALWALNGTWDSRSDPDKYMHYVKWYGRMAHKLSCRSDDIERALSVLGRDVRRFWQRLSV